MTEKSREEVVRDAESMIEDLRLYIANRRTEIEEFLDLSIEPEGCTVEGLIEMIIYKALPIMNNYTVTLEILENLVREVEVTNDELKNQ